MNNQKIIYGVSGLFIGGIGVFLVLKVADNTDKSSFLDMARTNSTERRTVEASNQIDAHFIEQMIPHHEDAVIVARLAATKAQTEEIKQLASQIITEQEREIKQMKMWYKDWFGKEVPTDSSVMHGHGMQEGTSMHMGMMGDETDRELLENAEDFDMAFIEHMIPHHQMAIMMAGMLKESTQRPEMVTLAEDIISSQTREIDQMRELLEKL